MSARAVLATLGTGRPLLVACLALAAVEAMVVWRVGASPALAAYLYLGAAGTLVSVVDARSGRIPDLVVLPSCLVVAGLLAAAGALGGGWWPLVRGAVAMGLVAAFYLVLGLCFAGQLGLGDVKLAGLLGLGLGWLGWPAVAAGVLAAWGLAALVVVTRRLGRSGARGATLAFGPWLGVGALVALVVR